MPALVGPGGDAEFLQLVGLARMVGAVVDQDHAGCAVQLGVGRLAGELRVLGQVLPSKTLLASDSCGSCRNTRTILPLTSRPA